MIENAAISNSIEEYRENIANKIWITRKARVEASERIKRLDLFTQTINIYYSITIIALSIWTLLYIKDDNNLFTFVVLIMSITLTILSVFCATKKYSERYISLKNNYLELDRLYYKVKYIDSNEITYECVTEIFNEYIRELEKVENHETIDYMKVLIGTKEIKISKRQYVKYYAKICLDWIVKIFLITFPIILVFIYYLFKDILMRII